MEEPKIGITCKRLSLTHFQTERVCRRQFLDSAKLKEFADDNFKFDKNGRKSSKRVENTVGKRRNCSLRAISPFPTVFSKGLFPRGVKRCHCVGMGQRTNFITFCEQCISLSERPRLQSSSGLYFVGQGEPLKERIFAEAGVEPATSNSEVLYVTE